MKASVAAAIIASATVVVAGPAQPVSKNAFAINKRASFPIPSSQGSVNLDEAMKVTDFDGGMKTYGRGVLCTGQAEGGDSDAVFLVKDGGSLSNVIIGKDQIEGVHCEGSCTITNVWWSAVCEDALSLKGDGDATISGGGATGADDKVIQHNGAGTVTISGFTVDTFGKLYRSCGNCKESAERHVVVKGVKASNGKLLVGINSNFADTATIDSATCATSVKEICEEFEGTTPGNEPESVSTGPSTACKYTDPLSSC
ncbi:pectate lyase [Setomelanomma holmii]|uniref:Pectate lyase n=1 Tax=Setomelanomma holmii TaxID=210430 RepID=A0A9P4LP97_9PLEO|nr:pectate lyase [Setomelanomma holmii]